MNSKALKTLLIVSGLIGAGVGAAILLVPAPFHATTGIDLGHNVSLLNEIRASGGASLAVGILAMLGAFLTRLTFTALVVSTLVFLFIALVFALAISPSAKAV